MTAQQILDKINREIETVRTFLEVSERRLSVINALQSPSRKDLLEYDMLVCDIHLAKKYLKDIDHDKCP